VIELHNRLEAGLFTDHDVERVQAMAQQSALAIENARLFDDVQQRAATLEMLLTFGEDLNYRTEPRILLRRVLERAVALVGARSGFGGLLADGQLRSDSFWQASSGDWQPLEACWSAGKGLAGWVLLSKAAYVTNDYPRDERADPAFAEMFNLHSAVGVPL